jgi:hypothetical protein
VQDAEKEHQLVSEGLQMKLVSEKAAVKAVECEKQELEAQLQEEKNSKENALKVSHQEALNAPRPSLKDLRSLSYCHS